MISFISDNGKQIKVDEEILITRQVANFKNFTIKGDYSISFNVENNSENRDALGYFGLNQLDSPIFSETAFNLVKDGNILMRGLMVIEEDDGENLSLYFVSGNSNWFAKFDFNCRDIRTDRWSVQWWIDSNSVYNCIKDSVNKTQGIVFPYIDWAFKGQKADRYILQYYPKYDDASFECYDYFPCVYLHTLLDELAIHSGVKIAGNLLDDKFFKTLILTPDSPDIYDPETRTLLKPQYVLNTFSEVKIQAVAPNIKAVDLIKWIVVSFGVVPTYDSFSNTLTLDLIDKRQLTGLDWSSYVKNHNIKYDQVQNNLFTITQKDEVFNDYNEVNDIQFGETNIESSKLDGQTKELYQSIFPTCYDWTSATGRQKMVYVPLYKVEDDKSFLYTDINNFTDTGYDDTLEIVGTDFPFLSISYSTPIRIVDNDGIYTGYHRLIQTPSFTNGSTAAQITGQVSAGAGTYPGTFFTQKVTKNQAGTRVLSYIPSIDFKDFTTFVDFNDVGKKKVPIKTALDDDTEFELQTLPIAYYYKPYNQYYNKINSYRQGLTYGQVSGYNDFSLSDIYLNSVKKMIVSPTIRVNMLIPEIDFLNFNFEFVYINNGKINGLFFVDSIVNYKDSTTLVEVNLIQIDG
jgi:hypothetical protein